MASDQLPRFIALKSQRNDKYLIHLRDDQDKLQFSGTDVASLHIKFEVEPSSTERGLVHLKCCYNNKYWVCKPNQLFISASANEKEEDQSKLSCTLFKPEFFTPKRIGLFHVHSKINVYFQDVRPHYLYKGRVSKEGDYLDFFDWDSLTILPRYIALKGNNKLYLSAYTYYGNETTFGIPVGIGTIPVVYLRFNCNDKGDQTIGNEVFPTSDGNIRIKNNHTGKFWRRSPNWIWPDSEDHTNNDIDTIFKVTKTSNNKIALQNLGNDKFCMSLDADGKNDCLNANTTTIPDTAKFEVVELVDKREIYNVHLHEKDARTYEKEVLHKTKGTDLNDTDGPIQATVEFEYTKEESQTWTTSSSLKLSAETEITVGVPTVVEGKLHQSVEVTTSLENGKTLSEKLVKKYTRNVTVQPKCKVIADFLVTQALCDIPYSYRERETLSNGKIEIHDRDDGLYTCIHTDVHFHAKQEKIPS